MIFSLFREDFGIFIEECFRAFGDHVKYWTTINEPLTFAFYAYDLGFHALGHYSPGLGIIGSNLRFNLSYDDNLYYVLY